MKYFLILALIVLANTQNLALEQTFKFNAFWNNNQNSVSLSWTPSTVQNVQQLTFTLSFNKLPATIPDILPVVFLKSKKDSLSYISNFDASKSDGNTLTTFSEVVTVSDFDSTSGAYKDCERAPTTGRVGWESQTCYGFLAFIHKGDSGVRDTQFTSGEDKALIRYEFSLRVNYNLEVRTSVETKVKTRVFALPCSNCGDCQGECKLNVDFKLSYILCVDNNQANCDANNQHDLLYEFGEIGYILFDTDIKTRKLSLHQVWAYSPKDNSGTRLSNSYVNILNDNVDGQLFLSIPIAGPATEQGLEFSLKFILRLAPLSNRILENFNDRRNLANTPVDVTYTDIQGMNAGKVVSNPTTVTQESDSNNAEMQKIYNLCFAILAIIGLACLCSTASNIIPLFRKKQYSEVPNQRV